MEFSRETYKSIIIALKFGWSIFWNCDKNFIIKI